MNEAFLSYVWMFRLYPPDAHLCCGTPFRVESPGMVNRDGGPDYHGARIRIGDQLWAGNVELHVSSSDWYLHRHHEDPMYDTVVLHVVFRHDREVYSSDGSPLPVFALEGYLDPGLYTRYLQWMADPGEIPCGRLLLSRGVSLPSQWLISLGVERLMRKSRELTPLIARLRSDWREMCYVSLCSSLGNKVNDDVFGMLALKTPWRLVQKYSGDRLRTEALLFGQSGLLEAADPNVHPYVTSLAEAWVQIRYQHQTEPLPWHLWRFLRTRPANFPTIRIAQLAGILQTFARINPLDQHELLRWHRQIPEIETSVYWQHHYHFGRKGSRLPQRIGTETADRIIINGIIPPLIRYSEVYRQHSSITALTDMLSHLPAEKNRIMRLWNKHNISPVSALESQGATELFNEYCRPRLCLECRFGQELLKRDLYGA